eukprot:TRINITY_DN6400_c0_g1_i1.p1 TRINITY_DN6400_c0_g1~~TRINITY_DN6400_c0_g1_i1.p1  ORF type:complete len:303 (-),score=36.79 TRINITY_DN6400_c0_g1_i1:106-1014(-)
MCSLVLWIQMSPLLRRIGTWNDEQSAGESVNSYWGLYLLGVALKDSNLKDWGRILLATELQSLAVYQHLTHTGKDADVPLKAVTNMTRCLSIIKGNALDGETYFGPNAIYECGIVMLPLTPITREFVNSKWAAEAATWMETNLNNSGLCIYPDPTTQKISPCYGDASPTAFAGQYKCCPVMVPFSAIPPDGPPKCDIIRNIRSAQQLSDHKSARYSFAPQEVQVHACNQWRMDPAWLPVLYTILGYSDPKKALTLLDAMNLTTPNPPAAPFPFYDQHHNVVGYDKAIFTRTQALFEIATHGQ